MAKAQKYEKNLKGSAQHFVVSRHEIIFSDFFSILLPDSVH